MANRLRSDVNDNLFKAILKLKDVDGCYRFFEDLCTVQEIKSMAQRLAVAGLIAQGESYASIAKATGASTATISRVKRCLHYGSDGYALVLEREDDKESSIKKES